MTTFAVPLISTSGVLTLAALAIVPPLLVAVIARVAGHAKPGWIGLLAFALAAPVFVFIAWPLATTTVRLDQTELRVEGGRYAVAVPYADIAMDDLVVGGPGTMPRLRVRTSGIGLPGAAIGWFRGDTRRVFAAYSGADTSIYVPTRGDFDLLLSPRDTDALVEQLRLRAR